MMPAQSSRKAAPSRLPAAPSQARRSRRSRRASQALTEQQIVLGRVKVGGPIVFIHSATDDAGREDGYFYAVVVVAAHRMLDCHVWSNNSVRVTARNVSASTLDLAAAPLSVQVMKRRVA